jgi:hypothetical protein
VGEALKARLAADGVRVERGKPGPREEASASDEGADELELSTE